MEHSERKPNRLQEYDYNQNGAYFVTICTQDRKKILSTIVGGGAQDAPNVALTDIGKIVQKQIINSNRLPGITVDKFVIMPDHIHLIVLVNETATFLVIGKIRYAMHIQKGERHLFSPLSYFRRMRRQIILRIALKLFQFLF